MYLARISLLFLCPVVEGGGGLCPLDLRCSHFPSCLPHPATAKPSNTQRYPGLPPVPLHHSPLSLVHTNAQRPLPGLHKTTWTRLPPTYLALAAFTLPYMSQCTPPHTLSRASSLASPSSLYLMLQQTWAYHQDPGRRWKTPNAK